MNILLLGASGFIGNALFHALVSAHNVTIAGRKPLEGYRKWVHVDFEQAIDWDHIVADIDLVINAVGVIDGPLDLIHNVSPTALMHACIKRGCRIIQISAIGAERDDAPTDFLRSKRAFDEQLCQYANARIVYPGIVIGRRGASTRFMKELADMPVVPILRDTRPPLIHITQLVEVVMNIVDSPETFESRTFVVSEPESLEMLLEALRGRPLRSLTFPYWALRTLFAVFPRLRIGLLSRDMYTMLVELKADDYQSCCDAASHCIRSHEYERSMAIPRLLGLASVFIVWLWSGIVSLVSWHQSTTIMSDIGISGGLSQSLIYAGAMADILLAFSLCFQRYTTPVLWLQVTVICFYTLFLTCFAPAYWLHPFGPLLKNTSLVALLYLLNRLEEHQR